ncbi:uncharacterized protein PG986_009918 [Apiospora aurea]|uniref:Uncharacterized protein n=1 Tax=Apiospora aurea TaxID=335848 RepID=A0ABR1Q9Q9_9PEZI
MRFRGIFAAVAVLSGTAAAVCTKWEQGDTSQESMNNGFSTDHGQVFERLACPAGAKSPCPFEQKPHHIVVKPDISSSVPKGREPLGLTSQDETDAIVRLAQDGYNKAVSSNRRLQQKMNVTNTGPSQEVVGEFRTLEATIHPFLFAISDRTVEPGSSATLNWLPFFRYSTGVLSGCSNETLNGRRVTVGAPYLSKEARTNGSSIAGTWTKGSVTEANHDDKKSGASGLGKGSMRGVTLGCSVAALVLGFMI